MCYEIARIVQEGLVNVRKHSDALHVLVRFSARDGFWTLDIDDDGRGFPFDGRLQHVDLDAKRIGPTVIRERVRAIGGQLTIDTAAGRGHAPRRAGPSMTSAGDDSQQIRLLIADDHPIFREGLRRLLESERRFVVIGEASDGTEAVRLARQLNPDVLLLDLAMPRVTGMAVLEQLADDSQVRTILLTAAIDQDEMVTALQFGARGIVLKEAATQVLFKSISSVMNVQYWVGEDAVASLIQTLRKLMSASSQPGKKTFGLTERELEIIAALVAGYSNKEIAQKFSSTVDTVKHHLTNIFDKVGVSSRLELALFAVHHKLVGQ